MDISMEKKELFEYNYLDTVKTLLDKRDYNLYFVLLGDKYCIKEVSAKYNILKIFCMNLCSGEIISASIDMLAQFGVKDINCLSIEILDLGKRLCITYSEEGINFLKRTFCNKNKVDCYREYCFDIHVVNLVGRVLLNYGDYFRKYKVLYIGQSKQDDIFKRLEKHSTIQRIHREISKKHDNKELYILLSGVRCNVINRDILLNNSELIFSYSMGKKFQLLDIIHKEEVVNIAEAILISYFKPEFNINLKELKSKIKTYSKFKEANLQNVYFSLDLYFAQSKEKSILFSDVTPTEVKSGVINCNCVNDIIELTYECLDDK